MLSKEMILFLFYYDFVKIVTSVETQLFNMLVNLRDAVFHNEWAD
jgi:hypothetical protein